MSGKRLGVTLGLWLLASGVCGSLTALLFRSSGGQVTTPAIVAEVYALLITALLLAFPPREVMALRSFRPAWLLLAVSAVLAAYAAAWAEASLVTPKSVEPALAVLRGIGSDDARLATAGPLLTFLIIGRACILAPIGEELLFRGTLHTWIRQRWGATTTVVATAAAFAAIHGFPAILPLALFIGIGLGWTRERCNSVVPAVVVHALNNIVLVVASHFSTGWTARLPPWG